MLTMLTTCMEKMNIVVLSAGMLDRAMAMSYEKFLLDLQIIAMVKRVVQGAHIDVDTLALDAIHEVGPGGEFLTHDHTLKFCRSERWPVTIDTSAAGLLNNHNDMMQWLRKKTAAMLGAYRQPELPHEVRSDMEKCLVEAGFDLKTARSETKTHV
jgi:trimethylamine--corrinoid protein Co-methyltransferase